MKARLLSIVAVVVAGILVLILTISKDSAVEKDYNTNLAYARASAEKLIPYNAYRYYQAALEIRCDDEAVYQEFLEQAKALGTNYYNAAVQDYVLKFPMSSVAYELLCKTYYESGNYSTLLDMALEAREKGAATEQVRNWYNECAYMLRQVKVGVEDPQPFLGGYALVKVNGTYGFLKENGDFLLAPVYIGASAMMGTNAAVNDGEEWHMINSAGFKVARTSKPVDYMGVMIGGKIPIAINGKYAYVTSALVVPDNLPYDYASNFKNGVAAVKKGNTWALINVNEEQLTDFIFEDVVLDEYDTCCNEGVIFVKKDGKYYMVNTQGRKISDQGFDDAKSFAGSGPAAVCISGKWGFVDATGNVVIDPQYEAANSFNIGLGGVCVDGSWGYINTNGTIRIECQFEDCQSFAANGIAAVKENGTWKYVRLLSYCD